MPRFPVVFLPGSIRPSTEGGGPLHELSYAQLVALRKDSGGSFDGRTPDPQARRIEFKHALEEEEQRFNAATPLQDFPALSQFSTLVEGVMYGHLRLRLFDLRVFHFAVESHLRYLGVLLDREDRALGGTDPHTLFFSASDALREHFAELERLNGESRGSNAGVVAHELLRAFRQMLGPLWQRQVLWMKLLDRLFFGDDATGGVNLSALHEHWKQVGPLTLRVSAPAGQPGYRQLYFPVYEEGYRYKVLTALSGDASQVNGAIQFNVNGLPAGRILMPNPEAVGGQDTSLLGAGMVETQAVNQPHRAWINYAQFVPKIQGLVNRMVPDRPQIAHHIAVESPFSYPDVIRVPVQHDGFVAAEEFRPRLGTSFGERFKSRMRGKGIHQPPVIPDALPNPPLIVSGGDSYYIDDRRNPRAVYVEYYGGERVDELTALGYVLWSVFDRQASANGQHYVQMNGVEVLRYDGVRYEVGAAVQPNWPDFPVKAAALQRLKAAIERVETSTLFKAAATRWMSRYNQQIIAHASNPTQIPLGGDTWYVDN